MRKRRRNIPVSPMITGELRAPIRADLASSSPTTATRDRDRSFARSCHRSRSCEDRDRAVDRDLDLARSRSTVRSREVSNAISPSRDHAVDRDLAFARLRRIEITINDAISQSIDREILYVGERGRFEIAIDASRDRAVNRDLDFARSRHRSRSREEGKIVIAISDRD